MSLIRVRGLHGLNGNIKIQGSKNAVLPLMAASLLHSGTVTITNVPRIQDVSCMMGILEYLGCDCRLCGHTLTIHTAGLEAVRIPAQEAGQMRSSVMLLGPLLGRLGEAVSRHPGGCSIGKRPIDLHLDALRQMGAQIRLEGDQIAACTPGLVGAEITLPFPSVGATETVVMAAVAASGVTVLRGAAREPEISVLCRFLQDMGAEIDGVGGSTLVIHGRRPLHDASVQAPGDRIVAGTYVCAVMMAGGTVELTGMPVKHMDAVLRAAGQMGCRFAECPDGLRVTMKGRPRPVTLATGVYPAFPTDLQPVLVAAAARADGVSRIRETVFERRFGSAKELRKLGAEIIIEDNTALIAGVEPLCGAQVCACDLRGGAALVIAGLGAQGETEIGGYWHVGRGYEDICGDLRRVGADIELCGQDEEM